MAQFFEIRTLDVFKIGFNECMSCTFIDCERTCRNLK